MSRRLRLLVAGLAIVFLAGHLRALPRSLEDRESIDLALGVEHFDVATGRPPAPGSPVFIGLARLSTWAVGAIAPGWDRDRRAAVGLAIPGIVAGTVSPWVFTAFWLAVGLAPDLALLAALVAVTSPLFWFGAARPLPDAIGVVAALAVATSFIEGLRRVRHGAAGTPRLWTIGALGAGFVIGLWPQAAGLVGFLFVWCAGELVSRRRLAGAAAMLGAAVAGILCWLAPVLIDSGGLGPYCAALADASARHLSGVNVLATTPTWPTFARALGGVLIDAWPAGPPAFVLLLLATLGLVWLAARRSRLLAVLVLAIWPYLLLVIVFEPTDAIRFALPVVIATAGLAAVGLSLAGPRLASASAMALALWSLVAVQPRLEAYAAVSDPVFGALEDMQRASGAEPAMPIVRVARQVSPEVGPALDWDRSAWPTARGVGDRGSDWNAARDDLRGGTPAPVWFVTDSRVTDCPMFDWRSCRVRASYARSPAIRTFMGGAALDAVRWWEIRSPSWMLGPGWAMGPDVVARRPDNGPLDPPPVATVATALLRRGAGPARVLIGGRKTAGQEATVSATIDDRPVGEWAIGSRQRSFVAWLDVIDTSGIGSYGTLAVTAEPAAGNASGSTVSLEQFDAAFGDDFITALGDGFYEPDPDSRTGRAWRWTADRAEFEVRGGPADGRLVIAGESPLLYFGRPPVVVVRAGEKEIGRFRPSGDFVQTLDVPADALAASGGRMTIDTDLSFVPADRGYSNDTRRFGLHLFLVRLERAR